MRSIVTGATGYLGAALVRHLVDAHGPAGVVGLVRKPLPEAERPAAEALHALGVRLLPCDLLVYPVVAAGDLGVDVLYHLAAETDSAAPPERLLVNTQGTRNLLHSLGPQLRGRRVVLAGATAAVDRRRRPRDLLRETDPPSPRTAYGRSKLDAERILAECAEEHGFSFAVPRFSPVWVAEPLGGFLGAFRDQVAARSLLRRVAWPGRITIVHRDDAVRILRHLGESGAADGRAVHVGDGNVYRYADLLRDLRRLAGDEGRSLPIPGFVWGLARRCAWIPGLRAAVPWRLSCLLGDDLAADTTLLRTLYPHPMRTWDEAKGEIRF
jgi:nucleoside-diphosphate-sugar epimerase